VTLVTGVRLAGLGLGLILLGSCGDEPKGITCRFSSSCPVGLRCVDGTCLRNVDGAPLGGEADGGIPTGDPDGSAPDAYFPGPGDAALMDSGSSDGGAEDSAPMDSGSADGGSCASGVVCASICVDPQTDPMHCGASDDCLGTKAGAVCAMGEGCVLGLCEPHAKRVFATSVTYWGNLGGLAGADRKCQSLADAASLGGRYKAWLASATSGPADRLTHSAIPYALVDGTVIANDWADLTDGSLAAPINLTETGGSPPMSTGSDCTTDGTSTWSSAHADGTPQGGILHCANWTTMAAGSYGYTGLGSRTSSSWSDYCALKQCAGFGRLYCFEQ